MNAPQVTELAAAAVHASRTAPVCVDCQHIRGNGPVQVCDHPATAVDPVQGRPAWFCRDVRGLQGVCGPSGTLFELATSQGRT